MTVLDAESRFHVLAVDDSIVDRKLIEMLLKNSSYQGEPPPPPRPRAAMTPGLAAAPPRPQQGHSHRDSVCPCFSESMTTVDSGSKALELLGLRDTDAASAAEDDASSPSPSSPDQQEIDVNLIITDYCMPGMTGYDLLKRVKGSSSLKDIPVVIMSSENVPARISRCLEDGAEEFFLKPVKLADMKKLKSHLLKRKQQPAKKQPPQAQQVQAVEPEPEQQPDPEPAREPEEAVAGLLAASDGTAVGDCNCNGGSKRKAAAMEQQQLEEGLAVTTVTVAASESTKPRLSTSSSLAVET